MASEKSFTCSNCGITCYDVDYFKLINSGAKFCRRCVESYAVRQETKSQELARAAAIATNGIGNGPPPKATVFSFCCDECKVSVQRLYASDDGTFRQLCEPCFNTTKEKPPMKRSVTDVQIGGEHYKKGIQPVDYIHSNELDFFEGNAIKYITRNKRKGNPVEDLKKAIHYLQLKLKIDHGIESNMRYDQCSTSG
jgi:hypothetical protein